ncbi:MAG: hypothetical protein SFV17_05360 [Candidatus Obscuribacter sp.]|nr:hypothetical protein [Candidatus Obscuribacter sp.]
MAISTELKTDLTKAEVSEAGIQIVESQNLGATDIAECSVEELKGCGFTLGDAKKLKRLFPGAAVTDSGSVIKLEVATAATSEVTTSNAPPVNPYAHLLGTESALGVNASSLQARINPQFINKAADGVLAFVLAGTGMLDVFNNDAIWGNLEDLDLRGRIDDWMENVRSGSYISETSSKAALEGISNLFGTKFEQMIDRAASLSAQQQLLQQFGNQARINVDESSQANTQLFTLLPLAAEEISTNMQASRLPESSRRLTKMVSDFMDILRDPRLAQATGVTGASADEIAIKFLERQLPGTGFANRFRLALAYERLVKALAQCPQQVDLQYIQVLGQLAGEVNTLFALVKPEQPVQQAAARTSQTQTTSRFSFSFKFSMSLKIAG